MIAATVTGNLGRDSELKDTSAGPVLSFSVASSRKVKGGDTVTWVRCSMFGKRGTSLAQYLTKGTKVAVSGDLTTREYQGKTYVDLRVSEIDLMGGGKRAAQQKSQSSDDTAPVPYDDGYDGGPDDDDIPF